MAKQAVKGAKAAAAKRGGIPLAAKVVLFASATPLIAVLFPTCLVLGVGMAPTLVAYILDGSRDRYFALTVGLTNFCGVLPGLADLWMRGHTITDAKGVVLDPLFWLFATAAAGVGWLIQMGMPPIIAAYYTMASEARIKTLMTQQKTLIETWGEEVNPAAAPAQEEPGADRPGDA